jgi:predicted nucleic acid-binding protein
MHNNLVITDTSCLISLAKLNKLFVLNKLYDNVFVTNVIADEYGDVLPNWIIVKSIINQTQ